jgi:opacity protein-like surface antigen
MSFSLQYGGSEALVYCCGRFSTETPKPVYPQKLKRSRFNGINPVEPTLPGVDLQILFVEELLMKKCFLLLSAALLTASVAAATDNPAAEAFLGYNWVRFNPDVPGLASSLGLTELPSFNLNGGNGQFVYNFTDWVGLVADIGAVHAGSVFGDLTGFPRNPGIDHTITSFTLGPRVTFHRHSRWMPFAQALFGGARATSSASFTLLDGILPPFVPPGTVIPTTATFQVERTGFAMLLGGGLDIRVGKHVALRPIGADYYFTRLPSFITGIDNSKHHFRYSAGVNFLFGAR